MDQTTDQITHDIRNKREHLRSNFQELESKVKSVTDWRHHFANHTGTILAAAFATGALVSILGSGRNSRGGSTVAALPASAGNQRSSNSDAGNEVRAKWNSMKSALVGVAATRLTGYLNQIVPGFHEELNKAETRGGSNSKDRLV